MQDYKSLDSVAAMICAILVNTQTDRQLVTGYYHAALKAGRSSHEKAVCLSVLSNAWIVTDVRKICLDFYSIPTIT